MRKDPKARPPLTGLKKKLAHTKYNYQINNIMHKN